MQFFLQIYHAVSIANPRKILVWQNSEKKFFGSGKISKCPNFENKNTSICRQSKKNTFFVEM